MVIMQDALPKTKEFLKPAGLSETAERHVSSFIVAFIMHVGRMSAATASHSIRVDCRHRAQVMRFLTRRYWTRDLSLLMTLAELLLVHEVSQTGTWLSIAPSRFVERRQEQGVPP